LKDTCNISGLIIIFSVKYFSILTDIIENVTYIINAQSTTFGI
jgi:hypothetical protein